MLSPNASIGTGVCVGGWKERTRGQLLFLGGRWADGGRTAEKDSSREGLGYSKTI